MEKHIQVVGIIHIIFAVLGIIVGMGLFIILTGAGFISQDDEALLILSIVGSALSTILLVISIPGLVAGIGLLKRKNWARILTIIISIIDLLNIPFGTALGIYSLWVLFNDETVKLFYKEQETNLN